MQNEGDVTVDEINGKQRTGGLCSDMSSNENPEGS